MNHGHSIMVDLVYSTGMEPYITGGPLNNNIYEFAQFHFHWSSRNCKKSEHNINGRGGPMEIHVVFFNRKYGNFSNASKKLDGLAVIGFIYEVYFNYFKFE